MTNSLLSHTRHLQHGIHHSGSVEHSLVRLRNAYPNANDTITLFSNQMQVSMHKVVVTAIDIMADYTEICQNDDCGDDNLMHAHLHSKRK